VAPFFLPNDAECFLNVCYELATDHPAWGPPVISTAVSAAPCGEEGQVKGLLSID